MSKFDVADLCDLVRDVADAETSRVLRDDLEAAPESTRAFAAMLARVAEVGRIDHGLQVPESAVRIAKAAGSLRRPAAEAETSKLGILRYLPFEVLFDSLLEPSVSGTRNLHANDRQLKIEAAGFLVDLRLEQDADPGNTVVVGQVMRTDGSMGMGPAPDVPVLVVEDGMIVSRATTGSFGEFHTEGVLTDSMSLCFLVKQGECVELPLYVN